VKPGGVEMPSLANLSTLSGPRAGVGITGAGVGLARMGIGGTVTTMTIVVGLDTGGAIGGGGSGSGELHAARSRVRLMRMPARGMADMFE